jgi:3-oxoacyl-[acyl-carrier protein] reductase
MAKNYIIIGGNSGIARATLPHLGEVNITAYSRQDFDPGLRGFRRIAWDVTQDFPGLPTDLEQIHGVLYAPGTITLKPFKSLERDQFLQDLEVNFLGALPPIKAALPKMKGGNILFFSTVAVRTGLPYHTSIAAAKGALEGFIRSLAAEYAGQGIQVNALALSLSDTPLGAHLLDSPEKRQRMEKRHPLGQVGDPEDLGKISARILTGEMPWMTGQILHIDGGFGTLII